MNETKHEFALHIPGLSTLIANVSEGAQWTLDDDLVQQRVQKILRLVIGDTFILFDQYSNAHCQIDGFTGKRRIVLILLAKKKNNKLNSSITCALPILKRDDFEAAIYMLAELGVNTIQLISTSKVVRAWGNEREYERLQRMVIAAAEQSKCFAMPVIHQPISLSSFLRDIDKNDHHKAIKIFFDAHGSPLLHHLRNDTVVNASTFILMVGPEGDLTRDEKMMVKNAGFQFCKLTSTTLRAVHAVCLGVGVFRSF